MLHVWQVADKHNRQKSLKPKAVIKWDDFQKKSASYWQLPNAAQ